MALSSSSSSSSSDEDLLGMTIQTGMDLRRRVLETLDDEESSSRPRINRRYIQRERQDAHKRLMRDYFDEHALFQGYYFRRRFRMNKPLFMRIVEAVTGVSEYMQQRPDARGTLGFDPIQKCTAVFRMLAYGTHPDALDESFRMSARTARESLHEFCTSMLHLYKARYLRSPTPNDIQQLYAHHSNVHGFPGMLGSLDCMHWRWSMCPYAQRGQYRKGNYQYPTVVLEAVASQDLWFWHGYFGSPGSINDVNILNNSPIFNNMLDGTAPDSSFTLRGREFKFGYYLADGIYPDYSVFVKTLSCPDDPLRNRYKRAQEKARKDIERAFGALKKRWHVVAKASTFRDIHSMQEVMYTCMILHNMILEDEGHAICDYDENEVISETQPVQIAGPEFTVRMMTLYSATIHTQLRTHLTEHLWSLDNLDLNMPPEDELEGQYSDEDPLL